MTAIELNQAKINVNEIFASALEGEEVIITHNEKPVLRLIRVNTLKNIEMETNALEKLQKIRISAMPNFSGTADLYSIEENNG